MYKSSSVCSRTSRRRERRRRAALRRGVFLGIAAAVCLLACAGRVLDRGPATAVAEPFAPQPQSAAGPSPEALSVLGAAPAAQPQSAALDAQPQSAALDAQPQSAALDAPPEALPSAPAPANVSESGWRLLLVNPWNPLPEGYTVSLTQLKNGHCVDERCYLELQAMMDACRAAGLQPVVCSSYRTQEKQERLFQNKVNQYLAKGYSKDAAEAEAGKSVAVPGTSEHQLGLALDLVDLSNQNLDSSQEETAVQQWLMGHSWEYGFILRYPNDKRALTGILYEPWHYRYVGKDAAREIYEQGICLEEYLARQAGNSPS